MKVESAKDLISAAWSEIQEKGTYFDSAESEQSVFQGAFKELLNWSGTLTNPSARVLKSQNFNIGLAVARFMYLIRGSNTSEEIAFYAPRVMDYSDDGKHLFGSAYGFKIFKENRFWNMAEKLKTTKNSKRLYFPIFTDEDFLRDSKDIPCAVGLLLEPRGDVLNATLLMRANDAQKLLPYNLFEFSLLHECLSVASGMKLGEFGYFAGTIHLRGDDVSVTENLWQNAESFEMKSIGQFDADLHKMLLEKEEKLRTMIPTIGESYSSFITELVAGLDNFWKEIFYILGDYGYSKYFKKHPEIIQGEYPLYALYRSSIPPQFL